LENYCYQAPAAPLHNYVGAIIKRGFLLYNANINPGRKETPMKRGRVFIYLALIIIIAVGAGGAYLYMHRTPAAPAQGTQATPQISAIGIITAGQNIPPGTLITEAMLSSIQINQTDLVQGEFVNKADLVNMYAKYALTQGVVITDTMVSSTPGANLPGSSWAPVIPQGLTAVAVPIKGLGTVAYGISDGDYVNVIVTMLLVDINPATQSILPDYTAGVLAPGGAAKVTNPNFEGSGGMVSALIGSGGTISQAGTMTLDQTMNQPIYLVPSEGQRPRMVTQMIMQDVQVLHVGSFPAPGETITSTTSTATGTPTPVPGGSQAPVITINRPDVVTLMVSPDDANTLVYLIYSGAKITLTLRNPNDTGPAVKTNAAMLEYLLTQYNIPIPAKAPFAIQPRLDILPDIKIQGDTLATPAP
jgi:Flp pilus assembly protein CpaB